MQAIILAGGFGTRLQSIYNSGPKSMAPISGKPFLQYIIHTLKNANIKNILILTGYKYEFIENYFQNGSKFGVNIEYSRENKPLGTGGAVFNSWNFLEDDFIIVNGDTFFDINYKKMIDFVKQRRIKALIALTKVDNVERYGLVNIDNDYNVLSFIEKGAYTQEKGVKKYINGGISYINKSVFQPFYKNWNNNALSLENDLFIELIRTKILFALPFEGAFIDIGIPEDYNKAQTEIPKWIYG